MTRLVESAGKSMLTLLLTASMLIATPTQAATRVTTSAQASLAGETGERAMLLAKTLNSEDIIIGDATSDEKATEFMLQLFGSQEELQEVEREHPGIGKELAAAALPIINRYMLQRLPQLQQRQADLYAANFDAPQLSILVDFYTSATGQKMIKSMTSRVKPVAMMAEATMSDDFKISANSVLKDIRATVPGILSDMNETDQNALAKLMQSELLPKLQALAPQTQAIALDWMQEYAEGEEQEIDKVIEAIIENRVGKNVQ